MLRGRWWDINIIENVVLPLIGGLIGSIVTIFWAQINERNKQDRLEWRIIWRYLCLGAISGFVAVNLLNQSGSLAEKIPLAILAGLSPVSYLRGQALTDGSEEHSLLTKNKVKTSRYIDVFNDDFSVEDPEEIVKQLKAKYNIVKGEDKND